MSAGIRTLFLAMLLSLSAALLMAQHGHGGSSRSASAGHSATSPFQMPSSIGLSRPAIGLSRPAIGGSAPVYGNRFAGGYPGFSQQPGTHPSSPYGPWRRGSQYGRFNYGLPYAYFGAPYYLPFYSNDFDSFNSSGYPGESQGGTPADDSGLSEQVQQLSSQINGLQDQLAQGRPPTAPPDYSTIAATAPPSPPLTVVLTSGQTLEVQNYAVMGDAFWDFSSQPIRKIPVSKIDVAASARASEANGAEFPQLSSGR